MKRSRLRQRMSGRCRASFTIEAAVVVPFVMLIFMAVLYTGFYVYDQVTVTAAAEYSVLEQAERCLMGRADSSGIQAALSGRLLKAAVSSVSVSGGTDHCRAEISASFSVPLLMVRQLTSEALGDIRSGAEGHSFDGRKKLLLYKSLCDGVSDVIHVHGSQQ